MKKIDYQDHPLYEFHSPKNEPCVMVEQGEIFRVHTQLCSGDWLQNKNDDWLPELSGQNNACLCIGVKDAKPGQMLAVDILDIQPDEVGYTAFTTKRNLLAKEILGDIGIVGKTVEIQHGEVKFSDTLSLPVHPMLGVIGTAPSAKEYPNRVAGYYGGNMDVQEVTAGARIYLPVEVAGALLHVGDAHAIQGDGEICRAGGIECRVWATLKVQTMERFPNMHAVRLENDKEIICIAAHESTEEAFILAVKELIRWMEEYGFAAGEAYFLLGQVMEARCSQFVNPTRTYVCKIGKRYLCEEDR